MNRDWRLLMVLLACGACSEVTIQQGLDERSANEIVAELAERGYAAGAQPEGGRKQTWAVHVPSAERTDAIRELVRLGLPRQKQSSSAELLKPGIVPSPGEERQIYARALQGDIARTLEQLDGVLSARVHLSLPPLVKGPQPPGNIPRGAVLLRIKGSLTGWSEHRRQDVRSLVSGSVEGLGMDQVTLVLDEVPTEGRIRADSPRAPPLRRIVLSLLALVSVAAVCWSCWGSLAGWFRGARSRRAVGTTAP